ncbi:MAG TPA: hypothetical protein VK157_06830 [Phycisphaerales bacterium]|nr:hypothetical protein [Phycisphaerales bacterium]
MSTAKLASIVALAGLSTSAFAQFTRDSVVINEIMINVPSPDADNSREWIELKSATPSQQLTNLWFVVIDGDNNAAGNSTAMGKVDMAINLSSYTTGSNGLLLLRDNALVLVPNPATETTVVSFNDWTGCTGTNSDTVAAIDIENGSATYLIVEGFTGSICQDLDTNNDGTLDIRPWSSVVTAVSFINGDDLVANIAAASYAIQLDGIDLTDRDGVDPAWTPDAFSRLCDGYFAYDGFGLSPGPWINDPTEFLTVPAGITIPSTFTMTPGSANIEECPAGCDGIDFNGNGVFPEDQDVVDFFNVLAGADCPPGTCNDIDFNNNGVFPEDQDVVDFFNVLAGGTCA